MVVKKFLLGLILIIKIFGQQWYTQGNPTFLTQGTLTPVLLNPKEIKIIVFVTIACDVCQPLKDNLEDITVGLNVDGRNDVHLYFVDCQKSSNICEQMRISDIPFIIVFNNFGQASNQFVVHHFGVEKVIKQVEKSITQIDRYNQLEREKINSNLHSQNRPNLNRHNMDLQQKQQHALSKIEQLPNQIPNQSPQIQRKKIVENVLNERNKKKSFFNLSIQPQMGTLLFVCFGIIAFIYIRKVLSNSNKSHKFVSSDRVLYKQVPNLEEDKNYKDFTVKQNLYDVRITQ